MWPFKLKKKENIFEALARVGGSFLPGGQTPRQAVQETFAQRPSPPPVSRPQPPSPPPSFASRLGQSAFKASPFGVFSDITRATTGVRPSEIARQVPSATKTTFSTGAKIAKVIGEGTGQALARRIYTGTGQGSRQTDKSLAVEANQEKLAKSTIDSYRQGKISRERAENVLKLVNKNIQEGQINRYQTYGNLNVDPEGGGLEVFPS